nr:uncharacterized protein LOC106688378 [Halyomorpha halys]
MGLEMSTQSKATQTKKVANHSFRISATSRAYTCCYQTRYPNTKATQTLDEFTISKKYHLKKWCLEEKKTPLCSRCITCNCIYDCSVITSQDIATLFKMLRVTNDNFEQFKFLAQHIKLDPYKFQAQFYVRIKRQGNWIIRKTCLDTFRHVFRISGLELSELVKRIASSIKEKSVLFNETTDDSDSETELRDYNQQGYVTTYVTLSKQYVRREIVQKWSRPNFKPSLVDLSLLDSFGFSNCCCERSRTLKHYLFHCPRFELARNSFLRNSTVEELYQNEKEFIKYVIEFSESDEAFSWKEHLG